MIYNGEDEVVVALQGTIPANKIYYGEVIRHRALSSSTAPDEIVPDSEGYYQGCDYVHKYNRHLDNIGNVIMDEFPEVVSLKYDAMADTASTSGLNFVFKSQVSGAPSFLFNTKTGAIRKNTDPTEPINTYTQNEWATYDAENHIVTIDIAGWVTAKDAGQYLPYSIGIQQRNALCASVKFKVAE